MIIVRIAGGLGNQMFEYAAARRLAIKRVVPLKLDLSGFGPQGDNLAPGLEAFRRHVRLNDFNIVAEQARPEEITRLKDPYEGNSRTVSRIVRRLRKVWPGLGRPRSHYQESGYRFDPKVMELQDPCYLTGFLQSEKYFADVRDEIRREFTPRDPAVMKYAREYIESRREPGSQIVSLHVRRGELAHAQDVLKSTKGVYGPPTGLDYLYAAMKRFDSSCRFLVFSDTPKDIAWCRENIKADRLIFTEGHSEVQDMMLISACDHNIVGASTFGWWASWLNPNPGRRVVVPRQWGFAGGVMVIDDLIPPGWEII